MVAKMYSHISQVHADDFDRQDAIKKSIVPFGCLRGGPFVMALHEAGADPCASCVGPPGGRDQCGGRPSSEHVEMASTKVHWSEDADARKARRAIFIQGVKRLLPGGDG